MNRFFLTSFSILIWVSQAFADRSAIPITILHTNDLHSHLRPSKSELSLGGYARIKTAVDRVKKENPNNTLFVDGGDWSEGNIYYTEGAGIESVQMLEKIGLDAAVIGNHDWLNGPDHLLNTLRDAHVKTRFVSANLNLDAYSRKLEFRQRIQPYTVLPVSGVRVAFIGLSTYDEVYRKYFKPVEILSPKEVAHSESTRLKASGEADVVVVISHNSIEDNKKIAAYAPNVDLIIGAHDHVKLTRPVGVPKGDGSLGSTWIVETGSWGHYLGRVDFQFKPGKGVELQKYRLIQMDQSIPEDPELSAQIETLEGKIENRLKSPIFHDHVGENQLRLDNEGLDNLGNLVTDSYRALTGADFAIDSDNFIYGDLHPGDLTTADVFNSNPAVFNPESQKTWTVKMLTIRGSIMKKFLSLLYSTKKLSSMAMLSVSGMSFSFNPWFVGSKPTANEDDSYNINSAMFNLSSMVSGFGFLTGVSDFKVNGQPMEDHKDYTVAMGQGMIESLEFLNSYTLGAVGEMVSLKDKRDFEVEGWKAMADFIRSKSPINEYTSSIGDRIQFKKANLAIYEHRIHWRPLSYEQGKGMRAIVSVDIRNEGLSASNEGATDQGPRVRLLLNRNGIDLGSEPNYESLGNVQPIPSLPKGQKKTFEWEVILPEYQGLFPVTVRLEGVDPKPDHSTDEVLRIFTLTKPLL